MYALNGCTHACESMHKHNIHMIASHTCKHMNRRKNKQSQLTLMSDLRGQGVKPMTTNSIYLLSRKGNTPGSVRRDQDLRAIFAWVALLSARRSRPEVHWYTHASMYSSINLSIYLSMCVFIHTMNPSIYTSIHPFMHLFILASIYPSIKPSIFSPIHSIHPSSQSSTHPFIISAIHPSIHPLICRPPL